MTPTRRSIRIWLIVGIIICAAVIGVTRLTDAFQLTHVTYNGNLSDQYINRFGLVDSASVFEQPLDSLADALLAERSVFRVDVDVHLPGSVDIRTNAFKPVCFAVDEMSGTVYGLTAEARAVHLKNSERDWEHPVFTGVRIRKMYSRCDDRRVGLVISQLEELETRNVDLYRMVEQIDFSRKQFVAVNLAGLSHEARVRPAFLAGDIVRYADFVSRYGADLTGIAVVDLRYDDMIVTSPRRR